MAYHPFRHLGLKFLSVSIAIALWFAVAGEQTIERTLRVPLAYQNQSETLELIENPPATVDVRVRGAAGVISHLVGGDVVAMLDLGGARAGRKILHLTPAQVRAPFGVEVTQVTPGTITLTFEPSLTKVVPIVPEIVGEPALGYSAGEPAVEPATVAVVGPESSLHGVRSAATEAVSIANASRGVRETVNVGVQDSSVRLKVPMMVTVTVPVTPVPVERLVQNVPVRMRGIGRSRTAETVPSLVSVSTRGPKDALDRLEAGAIAAYVDLAGLGPGRYNLPVRVEPPQNVEVLQTDPATVRVRIR
jgi:YbbR domain-containing protein